jgi:Ca2+-binding RTX toxin-like protein
MPIDFFCELLFTSAATTQCCNCVITSFKLSISLKNNKNEDKIMTITNGTNLFDSIAGKSTGNEIIGNATGDRIVSGAGVDLVFGNGGNDTIDAGANNDLVSGGTGNDIIGGGAGDDILIGGSGNDQIAGGNGDDIVSGGSGLDTFQFKSGFGEDTIVDFTFGSDRLNFYAGAFGNAKNITVSSFASLQKVITDFGFTVTSLDQDAVKVDIAAGQSLTFLNAASLFGFGAATPNAVGTSTDDVLFGSETDGGNIVAGGGNDTIFGGNGASLIQGSADNDVIVGGGASDTIGGQLGDDTILGNGGNDQLAGRSGNDWLEGGEGADTFRFAETDFGNDVVLDLDFSEGDRLVFFAGSLDVDNIVVTDQAELVNLIANVASGFTVDNGTLVVNFGSNSLTLAEYGDLVI